jgi:hypothetical protein
MIEDAFYVSIRNVSKRYKEMLATTCYFKFCAASLLELTILDHTNATPPSGPHSCKTIFTCSNTEDKSRHGFRKLESSHQDSS